LVTENCNPVVVERKILVLVSVICLADVFVWLRGREHHV